MFCNQCGREIRDDSVFCSYCGNRMEEEPDLGHESGGEHDGAPCVRPGAPKKHCVECGKELPSSAISDVCAMCTIRRRNREIDEERARRDEQGQKRDRYDISDEFDQSVFERDRAKYYHGEEPGSRSSAPVHTPRPFIPKHTGPEQKAPSGHGCVTAAVIALVMLVLLGLILFFSASRGVSSFVDLPEDAAIYLDSQLYSGDYGPYYGATYQWYDFQTDEIVPEEPLSVRTDSRGELLSQFIAPAVEGDIRAYMYDGRYSEDLMTFHYDDSLFSGDGIFITVGGTVDIVSDNLKKTSPFSATLIMSENYYETLRLELGGEELFDVRGDVDSDGKITDEGEEYYERDAGEPVFGDEEPLRLEDFH